VPSRDDDVARSKTSHSLSHPLGTIVTRGFVLRLDGNWEGFYAYDDLRQSESLDIHSDEYRQVKVTASFEQSLHVLTGQMRDIKPETQSTSFKEHLFQHRKVYGLKSFLAWQKVLFFRPTMEIEHANPAEASCNGHVRGDEVFFVKTYAGLASYRFVENSVRLSEAAEPMQPVTYRGLISEGGCVIQGRWSIAQHYSPEGTAIPSLEGSFELRRSPPIC